MSVGARATLRLIAGWAPERLRTGLPNGGGIKTDSRGPPGVVNG